MDLNRRCMLAIYTTSVLVGVTISAPLKARCYQTEENMAVFDHNEKVLHWTTFEECKQYCNEETSFFCLSVDYTTSGTCYLNNANHLTDPEAYGSHQGAIYAYVTDCDQSNDEDNSADTGMFLQKEISEDGQEDVTHNGRCYHFIHNKHLYGHDQFMIDATDLQDCLNKCDMEQSFICLAVNYLPSGVCELMPVTQEEEPELFDVFDDSVYAEVAECQSTFTRSSRFQESSEETDESSGSLSDENSFELYDWM